MARKARAFRVFDPAQEGLVIRTDLGLEAHHGETAQQHHGQCDHGRSDDEHAVARPVQQAAEDGFGRIDQEEMARPYQRPEQHPQ